MVELIALWTIGIMTGCIILIFVALAVYLGIVINDDVPWIFRIIKKYDAYAIQYRKPLLPWMTLTQEEKSHYRVASFEWTAIYFAESFGEARDTIQRIIETNRWTSFDDEKRRLHEKRKKAKGIVVTEEQPASE